MPLTGESADKGTIRVFVYGSLKRGHHNNSLLQRHKAQFMGFDTITGPFTMVSLGGFPGVVWDDRIKGATTIFGEVYSISDSALESLDYLESNGNFYTRSKFRSDLMDKRVWMYCLPYRWLDKAEDKIVKTGCWHPEVAEIGVWKARGVDCGG